MEPDIMIYYPSNTLMTKTCIRGQTILYDICESIILQRGNYTTNNAANFIDNSFGFIELIHERHNGNFHCQTTESILDLIVTLYKSLIAFDNE